jgi:hypothetical protein
MEIAVEEIEAFALEDEGSHAILERSQRAHNCKISVIDLPD